MRGHLTELWLLKGAVSRQRSIATVAVSECRVLCALNWSGWAPMSQPKEEWKGCRIGVSWMSRALVPREWRKRERNGCAVLAPSNLVSRLGASRVSTLVMLGCAAGAASVVLKHGVRQGSGAAMHARCAGDTPLARHQSGRGPGMLLSLRGFSICDVSQLVGNAAVSQPGGAWAANHFGLGLFLNLVALGQ